MTRPTINRINRDIAAYGVEIVMGNGYFYFVPLPGTPFGAADDIDSVYTPRLSDLTHGQWVDHVRTHMEAN